MDANIPLRKKEIPEFDLRELNRILSGLSRESTSTWAPGIAETVPGIQSDMNLHGIKQCYK